MTATAVPLALEERNTFVDRHGQLCLIDPRAVTVLKPTYVYNTADRDPYRGTRVPGYAVHCSTCGVPLHHGGQDCVIDHLGRCTVYCRHGHRN